MKRVCFFISPEYLGKIRSYAKEKRMTMGEVYRMIIEMFFEERTAA